MRAALRDDREQRAPISPTDGALTLPSPTASPDLPYTGSLTELQQLTAATLADRTAFLARLAVVSPVFDQLLLPTPTKPQLIHFKAGLLPLAQSLRDAIALPQFVDVITTGTQNSAAGA